LLFELKKIGDHVAQKIPVYVTKLLDELTDVID